MNSIKVVTEGSIERIKVIGALDEMTKFPEKLDCNVVIVDFDGLKLFNSMGVRIWIEFLRKINSAKTVQIENCRSVFLKQAIYVQDVIPPIIQVVSFYVPFFDPDTTESSEVKLVRGKDFDDNGYKVPELKNSAGKLLELDANDGYFDFLNRKP